MVTVLLGVKLMPEAVKLEPLLTLDGPVKVAGEPEVGQGLVGVGLGDGDGGCVGVGLGVGLGRRVGVGLGLWVEVELGLGRGLVFGVDFGVPLGVGLGEGFALGEELGDGDEPTGLGRMVPGATTLRLVCTRQLASQQSLTTCIPTSVFTGIVISSSTVPLSLA